MASRDEEEGAAAVAWIRERTLNGTLEFQHLDLASLASIRAFAERFRRRGLPLHILVANAGVMSPRDERTADGFEIHQGVKFLGHFYLIHLLLDVIKTSAPSRVVVVISSAEEARAAGVRLPWADLGGRRVPPGESTIAWYGTSNLCSLMNARELDRRLKASAVLSDMPDVFAAEWGAKSTLFCATEPSLEGRGGFFGPAYCQIAGIPISTNFLNTHRHEPSSPEARDSAACARLYDAAAGLLEEATGAPLPHRPKAGAAPAALAEE
jgi:NAD(P)-dependent dehydrogenase (short-subunit alcohol dehydrogenase family)